MRDGGLGCQGALSRAWSAVVALGLLLPALAASGCVTSLGYVPGYVGGGAFGPADQSKAPGYAEVREWASEVRAGWDTRMTLNRYMGYYGAILAAAATGAVTGLAAFNAGSSALVGIPIGTAFLGTVAAVFQSEDKAKIYGRGSRYVSDLIAQSDQRVQQRVAAARAPDAAWEAAKLAVKAGTEEVTTARTALRQLQFMASQELRLAATAPDAPAPATRPLDQVAAEMLKLVEKAAGAVTAAERGLASAQAREQRASLRSAAVRPSDEDALAAATLAEARCLERDVLAAMATVAGLVHPLAPDSAAALKAVKAPGAQGSGKDAKAEPKAKEPEKPATPTLADLDLPATSVCADDV